MLWYTLVTVSFTASAAPPAWLITAAPTRFTRSTGDWRRFLPPLFFFFAPPDALAERPALLRPELLRALLFFADPRAVGRFLLLPFFAPRADGRRDDFFAPRFAPRLLPFFAEPRAELEPERLPRFDLALVAICL